MPKKLIVLAVLGLAACAAQETPVFQTQGNGLAATVYCLEKRGGPVDRWNC